MPDLVRDNLCNYDPEYSHYIQDDEDTELIAPRSSQCYCDNCFYGRDKLAIKIKELEALVIDLKRKK
jgi:hypothetical protein